MPPVMNRVHGSDVLYSGVLRSIYQFISKLKSSYYPECCGVTPEFSEYSGTGVLLLYKLYSCLLLPADRLVNFVFIFNRCCMLCTCLYICSEYVGCCHPERLSVDYSEYSGSCADLLVARQPKKRKRGCTYTGVLL